MDMEPLPDDSLCFSLPLVLFCSVVCGTVCSQSLSNPDDPTPVLSLRVVRKVKAKAKPHKRPPPSSSTDDPEDGTSVLPICTPLLHIPICTRPPPTTAQQATSPAGTTASSSGSGTTAAGAGAGSSSSPAGGAATTTTGSMGAGEGDGWNKSISTLTVEHFPTQPAQPQREKPVTLPPDDAVGPQPHKFIKVGNHYLVPVPNPWETQSMIAFNNLLRRKRPQHQEMHKRIIVPSFKPQVPSQMLRVPSYPRQLIHVRPRQATPVRIFPFRVVDESKSEEDGGVKQHLSHRLIKRPSRKLPDYCVCKHKNLPEQCCEPYERPTLPPTEDTEEDLPLCTPMGSHIPMCTRPTSACTTTAQCGTPAGQSSPVTSSMPSSMMAQGGSTTVKTAGGTPPVGVTSVSPEQGTVALTSPGPMPETPPGARGLFQNVPQLKDNNNQLHGLYCNTHSALFKKEGDSLILASAGDKAQVKPRVKLRFKSVPGLQYGNYETVVDGKGRHYVVVPAADLQTGPEFKSSYQMAAAEIMRQKAALQLKLLEHQRRQAFLAAAIKHTILSQ
ncbi:unnamed protein product [Notodromas monacha]|uniref:Uncharacterized protein n=1 Tax=Notodromas monacha TaxID=399045 RepID=A0A7R9BGE1_9CRUS|nr:unnamed protein product [Notodromas monacha]CAG0914998.1 unnamed protein product [Notodromas monacha]